MDIEQLVQIMRENGIAGAGGAGFPTYAKLNAKAEVLILNCAECEPLLALHKQLLTKFCKEILEAFQMIAETLQAEQAIIAVKKSGRAAVESVRRQISRHKGMRLHLLEDVYPMGDEVVLIYETTGKRILPGGIPIQESVIVFNVETIYNVYQAWKEHKPVTEKYITIHGEVERPATVCVPIGISIEDAVKAAAREVPDGVFLTGGPMMGVVLPGTSPVTKTTNAVIVLPADHLLAVRGRNTYSADLKRAASACCQCETCTDLCPRSNLGHPIKPHRFMRAASNRDFWDADAFLNTLYCSSCGLCELYACPQGLSPRTLIAAYKDGLRSQGIKPPLQEHCGRPAAYRDYRKVPEGRLMARLGLGRYQKEAEWEEAKVEAGRVQILLSQHIGRPAIAAVAQGEQVEKGQVIGRAAEGLSLTVHASISGTVIEAGERHILIERQPQERS